MQAINRTCAYILRHRRHVCLIPAAKYKFEFDFIVCALFSRPYFSNDRAYSTVVVCRRRLSVTDALWLRLQPPGKKICYL